MTDNSRKMINRIRTDYLENKIAHYRARGWFEAEEALRKVARDINAPIDEDTIVAETKKRLGLREYTQEEAER